LAAVSVGLPTWKEGPAANTRRNGLSEFRFLPNSHEVVAGIARPPPRSWPTTPAWGLWWTAAGGKTVVVGSWPPCSISRSR